MIQGVYVPGTLALRVMQQPAAEPESVPAMDGVATQFSPAVQSRVIGLLAHNDLAGASFSSLRIGQEVRIVYGDGRVEYYQVKWYKDCSKGVHVQPKNPLTNRTSVLYSE